MEFWEWARSKYPNILGTFIGIDDVKMKEAYEAGQDNPKVEPEESESMDFDEWRKNVDMSGYSDYGRQSVAFRGGQENPCDSLRSHAQYLHTEQEVIKASNRLSEIKAKIATGKKQIRENEERLTRVKHQISETREAFIHNPGDIPFKGTVDWKAFHIKTKEMKGLFERIDALEEGSHCHGDDLESRVADVEMVSGRAWKKVRNLEKKLDNHGHPCSPEDTV